MRLMGGTSRMRGQLFNRERGGAGGSDVRSGGRSREGEDTGEKGRPILRGFLLAAREWPERSDRG